MTSGFEYTEIGTWLSDLPDGLVSSIGQAPDAGDGFGFVVRAEPVDVHVIGPGGDGPLLIEAAVEFPEEALAAVRAEPGRFFAESSAVLASAPGFHRFTDADGGAASAESFERVALRHYVYPGGASKDTVLTGVIDLLTAATAVRDTADRLAARAA